MANDIKTKRHSFQPGAMAIIQMGEELIGHPSTALNELIKNGYDADALKCHIYFNQEDLLDQSFVIIKDNGSGMNDKTLFGPWLRPSVSTKRQKGALSPIFKRHFLGSKGIGRLAAMSLGRFITVITKKEEDKKYNWITIDRGLFKEEKLLHQIRFPGDSIDDFSKLFSLKEYIKIRNVEPSQKLIQILKNENFKDFVKGTMIVIEDMDESVHKILHDDFEKLDLFKEPDLKNTEFYKSLATLITPLRLNYSIQEELVEKKIIEKAYSIADKRSSFSIDFGINKLVSNKEELEWQEVTPIPVQSAYDYRIYGKVTNGGKVDGYLSYKRLLTDEREERVEIPVSEIFEDEFKKRHFDSWKNEAGEYYFDIRVYDIGDKEDNNLEKLAKSAGLKSGTEFRNAFKTFQGLRVSKNGFGVKPYGEEVEDWIELSKKRVQDPGRNVNTNQILGYVFFYSPQNDTLEEKTNREGFLENKAFIQVKDTLASIFKTLGRRRYNYRLRHGLGRVPSSRHSRPNFEEFYASIRENPNIEQIRLFSEKFFKEVSTSLDNMEESLSFSERLASLGSGIELVYHEIAQPISTIKTTQSSLELKKEKLPDSARKHFLKDIENLTISVDVLTELRGSLEPAIGRTRTKIFKPYDTFKKVCSLFKSDFEEFNIKVLADDESQTWEIKDIEYAFWIAFLNIINNAVYWLKKAENGGEIRLSKYQDGIMVSNSGPLINKELIEYIFDYGVTTRQEKNATGLGLAFTRSALSRNNWNITAENGKNGPAFIITKTNPNANE
ncbi:sensor histidine kinase [Xanthocytophaga flava]|uniref:sensor histidine kinase n=1 Tax=Xanthocytophaga flava TaxID=3048013 RepID=UPI0028D70166|nr:sensor histidine kinase [Xanthocytophaga flavus]MDJ1471878.1 sensor histidine kinase [Xanthocytophaga flavus]